MIRSRVAVTVAVLAAIAGVAWASPASADSVSIGTSKDNTLIYADSADAVNSNGLGEIYAGQIGPNGGVTSRRGLLAFDVAGAIPAGATITSAALTLTVAKTIDGSSRNFTLHRVSADWGEGTSDGQGSGAPATAGDATWFHSTFPGTLWTTPGGDFAAAASATTSIGSFGSFTFASTPELVADVQSWLDSPTTNFGWLLRGVESSSQTVRAFHSRNTGAPNVRPSLQIEYTVAPTRIPGDTNGDGVVDLADLNNVLNNFGDTGTSPGDDNADGVVDLEDLNRVLNNFGDTAPANALSVIPEPATLSSILYPLSSLFLRRRRPRRH